MMFLKAMVWLVLGLLADVLLVWGVIGPISQGNGVKGTILVFLFMILGSIVAVALSIMSRWGYSER